MTLLTTDYLEYYLTLVAWIVHNGIWAIVVTSGVIALPFLAIILGEWLNVRTEGADEGNKGILSSQRIENRIWVAIVVVMFACVPTIDVDLATIKFDTSRSAQCQVNVPLPTDTGWSQSFTTLNNQSAKVPVWWVFMHALSRAVTGASVAAIPCGTDLRQMRMEINATRIADPVLAQEVADFTHDCYGPARAKLFMSRPDLDDNQMHDVTWIGSRFFTDTAGYYDTYRAQTPRDGWTYDSDRDAGLAQVPSGAGYPTCSQWWNDAGNGLRARLLQQVEPGLLSRIAGWAGFLSRTEVDDSVVRAIAAPGRQKMNLGNVYADYGGQIEKTLPNIVTRAAGDVGMAVGSLEPFTNLEIEHILPNKPEDDLRAKWATENPGMAYDDYKNRLGNLTLLEKPINIVAGNDFYTGKQVEYGKSGNYLTRSLVALTDVGQNTSISRINAKLEAFPAWNATSIEKRHALLIALAQEVWKTTPIDV